MLEFILTPRQKIPKKFLNVWGITDLFYHSFIYLCVLFAFIYLLFPFCFILLCYELHPIPTGLFCFFFVWETSNKPCACYFSSCCNKCSAIFTPKHRWYLKAKHRMSSENAGCTQTPLKPKPWKVLCCHHPIQPSIALAHVSVSRTSGAEKVRTCEGVYGWFVTTKASGSEFQKLNL